MVEIVAAFAASHEPPMIQAPQLGRGAEERIFPIYREMGRRLAEADPQALVLITNEHLQNFFLDNLPTVCIGMADRYPAPAESWLKVAAHERRGDAALGGYLLERALEADFDPAKSLHLKLDHGSLTPLVLADIDPELPLVPILLNNVEPPLPSMSRCLQWGMFIGDALRAYDGLERVAVLAGGGLSHSVGTPTMGVVNEAFDREFLRLLADDDPAALVAFARDHVHEAGNGGDEIRNWIVLKGIVGAAALEVLVYEGVAGWYTGTSVAQWHVRSAVAAGVGS